MKFRDSGSVGLGPSTRFGALHLSPGDELLNDIDDIGGLGGNKKKKKVMIYPTGISQKPSGLGEDLTDIGGLGGGFGLGKKSPWK